MFLKHCFYKKKSFDVSFNFTQYPYCDTNNNSDIRFSPNENKKLI